jgi:mannose-6-phosphate isomerase-like protein (cupin superfamily)
MSEALLNAMADLARGMDELAWFADRMTDLPALAIEPQRLPVCDLIVQMEGGSAAVTCGSTAPAVAALCAAMDGLRWQQTYTLADGFSQDWLDQYGWINLVSPDGIFLSQQMRLSIGYWGAEQVYDEHAHAPEETYVVLAGSALFRSEGRAPVQAGPGDIVHHAPYQRHAIEVTPGPLLAAAFWRGEGLMEKSDLLRGHS